MRAATAQESTTPETYFAPAFRHKPADLLQEYSILSDIAFLPETFDAIQETLVIINQARQVVWGNQAFLKAVGAQDINGVLGKRVGEALSCYYCQVAPGGCGTSPHCKRCGAVQAMLYALQGQASEKDCNLRQTDSLDVRDFHVKATPLQRKNRNFVIVTLTDRSAEKRKRILERMFFHDVMNMAASVKGLAEVMQATPPEQVAEMQGLLQLATDNLLEEIQSQRDLSAAEHGELHVQPEKLQSLAVLQTLIQVYAQHKVAEGKRVELHAEAVDIAFECDPVLLRRTLGNMIKNALEAIGADENVTVSCIRKERWAEFTVHNPTMIPPLVQEQIFSRSFSTKGADRGLGTYSIKLLTESYLKGQAGFTSNMEQGTTFFVRLPLEPAA